MEEIKRLNKELEELNRENEILNLKIRIARAQKNKAENEAELERLQDPSEPAYSRESSCCVPF